MIQNRQTTHEQGAGRERPYFYDGTDSSRNGDQQTGVFIQQVEEYNDGLNTPPLH